MDAALCHKHALKLVHYVEWERLRHKMQYCAIDIRKDGVLVYCHARRGPLIRMNSRDKPRIGFGGGCVGRRAGRGDRGRGPGRAKSSSISMADLKKKTEPEKAGAGAGGGFSASIPRQKPGPKNHPQRPPWRVLGVVFRPHFLDKNQVRKTTPGTNPPKPTQNKPASSHQKVFFLRLRKARGTVQGGGL